MAAEEKWYLSKEQLANTPSRKCGYDADKELSNRQQAANFIQDMGQRLQVTQLCINTAIVYMHRFYVYHSFSHFHRNAIATAALFLAAKVEEQPRKLEHVIKVGHVCLHRETPPLDTKSENYLEQAQELVFNENVLLQTLGFDVAIDHPHTHVVRCCHMVKASKDLAQTSYFMASNSLHLTTMCLQYKPTVVACFCIHLACKWSNWEIPVSNEGKDWFYYVDKSVTFEQLETLTTEFLQIFDKCPTKLKRKIMSITATQTPMIPTHSAQPSQLFDNEPRKVVQDPHHRHPLLPSPSPAVDDAHRRPSGSAVPSKVVNLDVYRRKEKERIEREAKHGQAATVPVRDSHHHTPSSHPGKPPPGSKYPSTPAVPGTRPPPGVVPPLKTPQNPTPREYGRPTVTASREIARREQAQAREQIKPRDSQQSSIFSPPTKHDTFSDSQVDVTSNHLNSLTSVNKNSSQEWQETLNHNNELETNRHHSDKYNLVSKDSRQIDPKRLHSKDQRLPVLKDGPKLSVEDSQRLYKYNHRKGEEGKEHDRVDPSKRPPDSDHALKRPSFGPTATPPVPHQLSKRNEFHPKREEASRPANSSKPLVPGSHHMSKSQHRVPSPVVPPGPNSRVPQPPSRIPPPPGSSQHRASSSQHRSSSPYVPHTQRPKSPKAVANPKLENIDSKLQKSVHATPTKVDPRNGHPIERREVNHRQDSGKQEVAVFRSDSVKQEFIKQEPGIRFDPSIVKQESGVHKQEVVRVDPIKQEVPRLDIVKHEPIERRPEPVRQEVSQKTQADAGRVLASILKAADLPKPDPQKFMEMPIKTENDTFSASSSQLTPKSSSSSRSSTSKSSVSGPNANSSSSSNNRDSYVPRPSKPSMRHPVTPPAPKKQYQQPELMSLPTIVSPEFGSPPPPLPNTPTKSVPTTPGYSSRSHNRNRTSSSSSEPELVPYVKKLEEIAGYENILDSKKGIKLEKLPLPGRVPDMIQPIRDRVKEEVHSGQSSGRSSINSVSKELRPPDLIKPFATQAPAIPTHNSLDVGAIVFPGEDSDHTSVLNKSDSSLPGIIIDVVNINETESIKTIIEPSKLMPLGIALESVPSKSDHPHKSEKKKKKEKHKHKDKDKNKDREERKHKRKHKDRDKEKHREKDKELLLGASSSLLTAPIKITIPKERLTQSTIEQNPPQVLKFKIQKPTSSSPQSTPGGELKLKISRNTIEGFTTPLVTKESRKRDRSASKATEEPKPAKSARMDSKKGSPTYSKHNGIRGQHHKVSTLQPAGSKGDSQPL